jgi:hypothetical protein
MISRVSARFARKFATYLGLALVAATFAGCRDELGPERMTTTSFDGTLTLRGQPFGDVWLEFMPIEGTVGLQRSARVKSDGTFHADAVPVGRVAMRVVGVRAPSTGDPGLDRFVSFAGQVYIIKRDVAKVPTGPMQIDLASEALAFARRGPEQ